MGLTRRELLGGGAAACMAGGCSPPAREPLSPEILAFHRASLAFDLHVDTLAWMRLLDYDIAAPHQNPLPGSPWGGHVDLPRAAEAGLDGAVLGIPINPVRVEPELRWDLRLLARLESERGFEQTRHSLAVLDAAAQRYPDRLSFARTGSELRAAIAAGRFAALAGLEGAHGIEDRLENVRVAWEDGLRMLGLVHFQRSAAAFPMTVPDFDGRGLTPFGLELIAEMESLGMVVDLAHVNKAGVSDALDVMQRPFVVSHTGCQAVHDMRRNLDDAQIRRIGDAGGVIGIAAGQWFLGGPGLDAFLDHVEHARRVGGAECVALGSDWDGGIRPVRGLEDVRGLPWVTAGLLERGWPPDAVRKALGENALRVITDVCG